MYMCREIPVFRKDFSTYAYKCRPLLNKLFGRFVYLFPKKVNKNALTDDEFVTFGDKNLKVLGVTEDYIDYFYQQYLLNLKMREKVKEMLKKFPNEAQYKCDVWAYDCLVNSFTYQIFEMYRISIIRLKCPKEESCYPLYWWMQCDEKIRNAPNLQKFKTHPELKTFGDGESYINYCQDIFRKKSIF